jgi:nitrous-oxide reductase
MYFNLSILILMEVILMVHRNNTSAVKNKLTRRDFIEIIGGFAIGSAAGYTLNKIITPTAPTVPVALQTIIAQRNLTPEQAEAALKTYVPGGGRDEFIMFASGGHSGQVLVIGIPSMRILKVIGVFTPEPWQGYGYGTIESRKILEEGSNGIRFLTWGDVHHPEVSRTNGEFDGEWLFVSDKANGRVAVVSLKNFMTKQIVKIPNMQSNHCGSYCSPNTEYVVMASQYPAPWDPNKGYKPGETFVELNPAKPETYKNNMRGIIAFLSFDRNRGIIDLTKSFEIELPPYMQDLLAVGWGPSDGICFMNSFDTELAFGGILEGKPPLESGAAANNYDYLHIVFWKKAEELIKQGKYKELNGIKVIPLDVAAKEGILYFAPEPKSPHGCDIAPNGDYVVVGGKLAPVVTIYNVEKIKKAIENKNFEGIDPYGVPILKFDAVKEATIEVGLGPLHTEFDDKGYAYTSLFIDNKIVKWTLGPPYHPADHAWKVVDKIDIHYNIGHLAAPESNSSKPKGKYLVALNKWSIDRFNSVGPLRPQNFQLIDISGEKMQLLYDMPIGLGEPHYAKIISASKLKPLDVYPVGANPLTLSRDPNSVEKGKERIERKVINGQPVTEVWATLIRSRITPDYIRVKQGDKVIIHLTNVETTIDATHGFSICEYNITASIEPGETVTVEFIADKPGVYAYYCTEFCSPLHLEMMGWLVVEPT